MTESCDATQCQKRASTKVRFPRSESEEHRCYCDECARAVLRMGVRVQGAADTEAV